jgi:hypothetical protein
MFVLLVAVDAGFFSFSLGAGWKILLSSSAGSWLKSRLK